MKRKKGEQDTPPKISSGFGFTGPAPRSSFKPQSSAAPQDTRAVVDLNALRDEIDYERERQILDRCHVKSEQPEQGQMPHKSDADSSSGAQKERQPATQLTDRETRIWGVIQRGVTCLQYCRELDNAGVAPLRSGVWKVCPSRKYESAYKQGAPWPHRIQDEKSKIRHKFALAGLAKLASE